MLGKAKVIRMWRWRVYYLSPLTNKEHLLSVTIISSHCLCLVVLTFYILLSVDTVCIYITENYCPPREIPNELYGDYFTTDPPRKNTTVVQQSFGVECSEFIFGINNSHLKAATTCCLLCQDSKGNNLWLWRKPTHFVLTSTRVLITSPGTFHWIIFNCHQIPTGKKIRKSHWKFPDETGKITRPYRFY